MTTIISSRNLLQVTGEWPVVKFTAEFHVEGADIKRISNGAIVAIATGHNIGSFNVEEGGQANINIYQGGSEYLEGVCAALPAFIADVKTQIAE